MKVNHKKIFVRLFIFLFAGHGFVAQASGLAFSGQSLSEQSSRSSTTQLDAQVDSYIKQQVRKYKIPGLSIAVVRKGRVVKLKGYGVANVEFDVSADTNTVYQLFRCPRYLLGWP